MGAVFQSLMNCKGCISLYFYDVGYCDPRYGSPTRDKNSIRHCRKSKGSCLKIPLKGNHILKFYTLIIDISCSLKSEISRLSICRKHCTSSFHGLKP